MTNPNLAADVPKSVGRTFLIGGTAVAGLLLGTFFSMSYMKKREQAAGRNPHHEQLQGALQRPVPNSELLSDLKPLKGVKAQYSDMPPAFPGTEYHSGHQTLSALKQELRDNAQALKATGSTRNDDASANRRSLDSEMVTPGRWGQATLLSPAQADIDPVAWQERRNMVPPPQRAKQDESGRAYTKGPDYVKNYEKTPEGKARVIHGHHEMH